MQPSFDSTTTQRTKRKWIDFDASLKLLSESRRSNASESCSLSNRLAQRKNAGKLLRPKGRHSAGSYKSMPLIVSLNGLYHLLHNLL